MKYFGRPAQKKPTIEYTVCEGDTLSSIAAKFNSTPSTICELNRGATSSSRTVFPGTRLSVPCAGAVPDGDLGCPAAAAPGHVERVEDPSERNFVKVGVRLLVVEAEEIKGTLLVTPTTLLFDPDTADPVVAAKGAEKYGVTHELGHLASVGAAADGPHVALCAELRGPSTRRRHSSASHLHDLRFLVSATDAEQLRAFLRNCRADEFSFKEPEEDSGLLWRLRNECITDLPQRELLPLPRLLGEASQLLDRRRLRHLVHHVPPRAEGLDMMLLYCARLHGFSLQSVYRSCRGIEHDVCCALLVLDTKRRLFGALLSAPPRLSEHFYGTGETFVFRWSRLLPPELVAGQTTSDSSDSDADDLHNPMTNDFYKYAWSGENSYFMRGATDSFCVGSHAIWLDAGLRTGRTQQCETFNCPVLTGAKEDFIVSDLELWAFACNPGQ